MSCKAIPPIACDFVTGPSLRDWRSVPAAAKAASASVHYWDTDSR